MLIIDTLSLPLIAGHDITQQYEPIGAESIRRFISGRALKQMVSYAKLRVTTSGRGWIPSALDSLDFAAQHTLKCIAPRRLPANFATRQVTLPSARRSDSGFTPWGYALLADGSAVAADLSLAGDVATVAAVAGAVGYAVAYLPELTVYLNRPSESFDQASATWSWDLTAEEV